MSERVAINVISIIFNAMSAKIVKLSVTCETNWAESGNLQKINYFASARFLSFKFKLSRNFMKIFEETWKTWQQQIKTSAWIV